MKGADLPQFEPHHPNEGPLMKGVWVVREEEGAEGSLNRNLGDG